MEILEITEDNFQTEVIKAGRPVLLEFYADGCGPCRAQLPILEQAAREAEDVKFCKANAGKEKRLAEKYGVSGVPVMFIQNGEKIYRTISGLQSLEAILAYLEM